MKGSRRKVKLRYSLQYLERDHNVERRRLEEATLILGFFYFYFYLRIYNWATLPSVMGKHR